MRASAGSVALVWYYLATPVFALLDLGFGLPVRVAGLADPFHRGLYYLALVAIGIVLQRRPVLAPWVGMGESVVNLFLLLLSVLLPVWSAPDRILAGEAPATLLSPERMVNVLVAGAALVMAFHRHQAQARRTLPR